MSYKSTHDARSGSNSGHSSYRSTQPSRSRSRLPTRLYHGSSSPTKPDGSQLYMIPSESSSSASVFRERSTERAIDKAQKSDIFKKDNLSLQDIALLNTSFNNKIRNPEHRQEQDRRGRSRERDEGELDGEVDTELISLMGFQGFGTTKGKAVKGAKGGKAKVDKKPDYRQYMNREKGFNRPLSPGRK